MLEKEFQYYLNNQDALLTKYDGKYLVVVGEEVKGAYEDAASAIYSGQQKYQPGTFLVQLCTPGNSAYTIRSCSRITLQ